DEAAQKAIEQYKDADPQRALEKVLMFYEQKFDLQIARGRFGSHTKAVEAARGVINAARELLPFFKPKLAAVALQAEVAHHCVIRAPEIEPDGSSWLAKYGPKDNAPALPNPVVDQIVDAVATEQEKRQQQEYQQRERDWQVQYRVNPSPEEWEAAERALAARLGKH